MFFSLIVIQYNRVMRELASQTQMHVFGADALRTSRWLLHDCFEYIR